MASELGKQLLTRVQEEMTRNISTIKTQFVEWLERPETGSNLTLKDHLMEISGGLSLLGQNEAAELSNAICNGIDYLNTEVVPNLESKSAEFAIGGSELASALLILADYIEQLGGNHSEENKKSLTQSAATINAICSENGEKTHSRDRQKPTIGKGTYQAIAEKVSEILDISRNKIEQNTQSRDRSFKPATLIENHEELLSLFDVLDFKAPQILLKQINKMLVVAETEKQWIEIAEAILLVDNALKQINLTDIGKNIGEFAEALQSQTGHSRHLEVKKLIKETGISCKKFFEDLRKSVINDNSIHGDQSWQEAIQNLKDYGSILELVGFHELAKQFQHLGLVYAEMSFQSEEVTKKLYPFIVDSLVAVEYLANDLTTSSQVLDQDVRFLHNTINSIVQKCKISDQAKRLFANASNQDSVEENADADADRDLLHVDESFAAGLAALDDDFSALELKHLDDLDEKKEEEEEEPELTRVSVVASHSGGKSEEQPVSSISVAPSQTGLSSTQLPDSQDFSSESGVAIGGAFFANKSISDLEALDVPEEKLSFMESHADAVVDDEIREFFIEEFIEIIEAMNEVYPKWCESPDDAQLTNDIRRHFHTLKGSGRTVGYEALGECAWQHEQLLNRVIDKDYPANSLVRETVSDAIDLLNILEKQEEFVEYKGALLQQALVAEKVRNSLLDDPESSQEKLDQLSKTLRLGGAGSSSTSEKPPKSAESDSQVSASDNYDHSSSDWDQADELADLDLSLDDKKQPETISTAKPSLIDESSTDQTSAGSGSSPEKLQLPIGVMPGSYQEMLSTLKTGLPNAKDKTAISALAETIGHQWQKRSSLQDPNVRAEMAKKFAETTNSDVSFMGEVLDQAAEIMAKEEQSAASSVPSSSYDDLFDLGGDPSASVEDSMSTSVSADLGFNQSEDETVGSVSVGINDAQSTESEALGTLKTSATETTEIDEENDPAYQRALNTLKRALEDGTPDEDTQAVLANVIANQLEKQHLDSPAVLAALEQKLISSFESSSVDKNVISQLVGKIGSQHNTDLSPTETQETLVDAQSGEEEELSPEVYGKMLNTLRRGLSRSADDEDMQDALVGALLNQWSSQQGSDTDALPESVAMKLAENLMQEGNINENALMQIVSKMTNQQAENTQPAAIEIPTTISAASVPEGVDDESYNRMLNTLRRGLMAGGADKEMQDVLTETISRQWNDHGIETEGEIRDNIISHLRQSLVDEGIVSSDVVDNLLANVPVAPEKPLPEGVLKEAFEKMLATIGGLSASANADEVAALASSIAEQWESKESLQNATARAAVAEMLAEKTGGDAQTISNVLEQAASQAQKAAEHGKLPAGVVPEAYEQVASTMSGLSANTSADEVAALASSIAEQWESKESLQNAAARAAVAEMLAEKTGGDAQAISNVLEQAASQAQKATEHEKLPAGVVPETYEQVASAVSELSASASADEVAALASNIAEQWESKESLQNATTRAAVAEMLAEKTGGDIQTINDALEQAANHAKKTAEHAALPEDVIPEAYEQVLSTVSRIPENATTGEMQSAVSSIVSQWERKVSLQNAEARAAVAELMSDRAGKNAKAIEDVFSQAASYAQNTAQHANLPEGVVPDAYEQVTSAVSGLSANAHAEEMSTVATTNIAEQWETKESLQNAAADSSRSTQATTAQTPSGAGYSSGAISTHGSTLPEGVMPEAYEQVASTVGGLSATASADEISALASNVAQQWETKESLQNASIRAAVAEMLAEKTGHEAKVIEDVLNQAAGYAQQASITVQGSDHIGESLDTSAAVNAQLSSLPEGVAPEAYQQMVSALKSHLAEPNNSAADVSALIDNIAQQWQTQESLQNPATRESVAQLMSEIIDSDSDMIADLLAQAAQRGQMAVTEGDFIDMPEGTLSTDDHADFAVSDAEIVGDEFEVIDGGAVGTQDLASHGEPLDVEIDPVSTGSPVDNFIDANIPSAPTSSLAGTASNGGDFIDAAPFSPSAKQSIKDPRKQAVPAAINPRERLQQELQSLSQPSNPGQLQSGGSLNPTTTEKRAVFLRAVDQFESLSQLAEKEESPEIIDDLINSVYDIEDSIDSETAPAWIWRLLDSIEQLLLMYKHQGTPVTLSCAEILRQSAGLIEHHDEENSEDEAMEAINSLMNARKNTALPNKSAEAGSALPSSHDGLITPIPKNSGYSTELLWGEMIADPNANTVLAETFLDEAMSLFAHSQEEAERWDENRNHLGRLDSIRRNMHTLKGSARMAGYMAIGDLTHGVESLLDAVVDGHAEGNGKAAAILIGAMWQGMLMLDNIRDGFLPQTDPYIINNIHEFLGQPLPYPEVAAQSADELMANIADTDTPDLPIAVEETEESATPVAEIEVSPADEPEDSMTDEVEETKEEDQPDEPLEKPVEFDENIDPVLVDIFTDEAQELLETTSTLFEGDFSNSATIEELQRTMHTLKGGARLVGFTAIGDTAHLMESVIDKIPELPDSKVRQAKTLLNMGLDTHYEMLDSVMRHEMPRPATDLNESLKTFAETGQFINPAQKPAEEKPVEEEKVPEQAAPEPRAEEASLPEVETKPEEMVAKDPDPIPAKSEPQPAPQQKATGKSATKEEPVAESTESAPAKAEAVADSAASKASAPVEETVVSQPEEKPAKAEKPAEPETKKEEPTAKPAESPKVEEAPKPAEPKKKEEPPKVVEEEKPAEVISKPEEKAPEPEEKKPDPKKEKPKDTQTSDLPRYVRVDAQLLDEMIAMIGETAIMRSRMENVAAEAEFNLNELTRVVSRVAEQMRRLDSETEAQMLYRREQQGEDDEHFDPLEMDRFSEIQQLSRQLSEAIDDLKNLQETLSHDNSILRNISTQQGVVQRSIQDRLLTTQLMRFDVHEPRLKRLIKQTAKSVGKEVNFVLEGGEVELERRLLEDILPALEHMIRNSLAHGIEKPADRIAAGKSEVGTVKLVVEAHASELSVRLIDDGQGLNYDRIREKAAAKGMLDPERADDEAYLSSLILRSGFSTAESLSQLSGRGVGMDVVNEMIKQRRGQILAHSITGQGTEFTLKMPFSMSIAEVLLVEIAGQVFAAPMSSIAAISQVDKDALQNSVAGEVVYQHYNEMEYRLFVLGAYFKPEAYEFSQEENSAPVLFINAGGSPVAFHVDRILNRLEIIVKNVNRQVLNIPGISGATILGDGRVVPVLELLDLSRRIANLTPTSEMSVEEEADTTKNILVVDDSVTMRKVSTRLLERNHYNVATAKDGLDAIDVLETFVPDLIMLDIEMPRMDGFEFAAHVRNNSQVPNVPIVMITSRTGDKHRERADQIGVQGYLGKPYSEEKLIETLESLLTKEGNK